MSMACFMVRDREETDVPNELATSLAPGESVFDGMESVFENIPMFQASRQANMTVKAKM
jgi:hypothetical protein